MTTKFLFEEIATDIDDQSVIDKFISQSFNCTKINNKTARLLSTSQQNSLLAQRYHHHLLEKACKYSRKPTIQRYSINHINVHQPESKMCHPLQGNLNLWCRQNETTFAELHQWTSNDVTKDNYPVIQIDPLHRNMVVMGKIDKHIGIYLNKQVMNDIEQYDFPLNIRNEMQSFIRILIDPSHIKLSYGESNNKEALNSQSWIPSVFQKDKHGNIRIISDINNLSRIRYPNLYDVIAAVFKKMLASFEWVSGYDFDEQNINEYKVVVQMMNYELVPHASFDYRERKNRIGTKDGDNIIAVGIYHYYISEKIGNDIFSIVHEHGDIEQDVLINQDDFIVFNNRIGYEHYVNSLRSCNKTECVKRKSLIFYLVDPMAKNCMTSRDFAVNLQDKLDFILINWHRKYLGVRLLGDDIINLVFVFVMDPEELICRNKCYFLFTDRLLIPDDNINVIDRGHSMMGGVLLRN